MNIVRVTPSNLGVWKHYKVFNKLQFAKFKQWILEKYRAKFVMPVTCKSAQCVIWIDKDGLKHGMNLNGSIAKTKVVTVLDKLIQTAMIMDIEVDRSDTSKKVMKLFNLVSIDERVWRIEMTIKQYDSGRYYYFHKLSKIEKVQ